MPADQVATRDNRETEAQVVDQVIDITIILVCITAAPLGALALNTLPITGM
jgi:hypothetical protein